VGLKKKKSLPFKKIDERAEMVVYVRRFLLFKSSKKENKKFPIIVDHRVCPLH
jgi:hypothetical protein